MKSIWFNLLIGSVFVLLNGNAFAKSNNGSPDTYKGNLVMADASRGLDITMEVIEDESDSPDDIINIIELPVSVTVQERKRQQNNALSNRPEDMVDRGRIQSDQMYQYREQKDNHPGSEELSDIKQDAREHKQQGPKNGN